VLALGPEGDVGVQYWEQARGGARRLPTKPTVIAPS
jgi:hypothetical protein